MEDGVEGMKKMDLSTKQENREQYEKGLNVSLLDFTDH